VSLSLRQRTLLWIVAIHLVAFAAEYLLVAGQIRTANTQLAGELADDIVATIRGQLGAGGEVKAARILNWPRWKAPLEDAILTDRSLARAPDGSVQPRGLVLNPMGALERPAEFDYATVFANIALAVQSGRPVDGVAGGHVVPIDTSSGVWGACWYRIAPATGQTRRLLGLFLAVLVLSSLILSLGLFYVMRREVLDPVTRLTRTARRVAEGDLAARVESPSHDDELGELSRTFNAMVGEVQGFSARLEREVEIATEKARSAEQSAMAERRLAATGKLAAGIAHEINNPLGGLINAVERLRRDDLPPAKRAEYLALLSGGLERIRDTVGKLLRLTPRPSQRSGVQVAVPVLDAISLVRHRAQRAGVAIAISDGVRTSDADPPPPELAAALASLPRVTGDSNEIGQAVLNLLVNSLDALAGAEPGHGRIEVALSCAYEPDLGPALLLDVRDNGPGVPTSELGKLLDLFYTTKQVGHGTGLGLALVHSVVKGHGGTLELDSAPGLGFHARIAFPTVPEAHREGA
jgi:signal transduction histidine kinase